MQSKANPTKLKSVVIVEDESNLGMIFKDEILNAFPDFSVSLFESPKEAFAFIKENQPDLIITDGKMPEMTGVELAEAVLTLGHENPLYLVTGHMNYIDDIKNKGIFEKIFEKPVDFDELIQAISHTLDTPSKPSQ